MRTKTTDEPFEENLEDGRCDERIEETDHRIVHIPKRSDADLNNQEGCDWDERCEECSFPNWNDFVTERLSEYMLDIV